MPGHYRDYVVFSLEAFLFFVGGAMLMLPVNLSIAAIGLDPAPVSAFTRLIYAGIDPNSTPGAIASLWCAIMGTVTMYFAVRHFNARSD